MLKVPRHLLGRLLCAHCHGYLDHSPIMAKEEEHLCGRCHSNLPENDKHHYVRQMAYETVAELLIFPCRYHSNGCGYTFVWNQGGDHANNCLYRSINITLATPLTSRCHKCNRVICENEIYQCLFGHNTCQNCKGQHCNVCQKTIMKEALSFCKNCDRGCQELLTPVELSRHQIDCEYAARSCLIDDSCQFEGTLKALKQHVAEQHPQQVSGCPAELFLESQDRVVLLECYGELFVFKYWYYGDFVEFLVQYVGSSDNARSFKYTVQVPGGNHGNMKKETCLSWNDMLLGKGFEVRLGRRKVTRFMATVDIFRTNVTTL